MPCKVLFGYGFMEEILHQWIWMIFSVFVYCVFHTWVFPKIGVPQNGWFIRENPILNG